MGSGSNLLVLGGGVLGLAISWELAEAGFELDVVYPEDEDRDHATLAAGAMIGAFGELTASLESPEEEEKLAFRVASQNLFRPWLERLRQATGRPIHQVDGLFMVANPVGREDGANLEHITRALTRYGRAWEEVAPVRVPGLAPKPGFEAHRAVFIPDDLSVDAAQLLAALEAAVAAHPRVTIRRQRVLGLEAVGEVRWRARTTAGEILEARQVVVCAGARVPEALGELVLAEIRPPVLYFAKGIGCTVTGAPEIPHAIRTPNRSAACGIHVTPRAGGRTYLGASNHYGYATAAARGITPGELTAILGMNCEQINAQLRDATIESQRFGLRPMTWDDRPLVGRTPLPGLFLATGTRRTGIVMAPRIAQLMVEELSAGEAPPPNPFALGPERQGLGSERSRADLNVAILWANRGLHAYYRGKLAGTTEPFAEAIAHWRRYVELAGDAVDTRLVALLEKLESHSSDAEEIW